MRATKKDEKINLCDKLTVDTQGLQNLLDCGRVTAVEIGSLAGARIEMGKRVLDECKQGEAILKCNIQENRK